MEGLSNDLLFAGIVVYTLAMLAFSAETAARKSATAPVAAARSASAGVALDTRPAPVPGRRLGRLGVALTGSDTSSNVLFGNLQKVTAEQLGLSPILMAASNSSGGVMGKMISPQNIATGVSVTDLKGQEGVVFARTFKHSIILTVLLGVLVVIQQYVTPWMIPH